MTLGSPLSAKEQFDDDGQEETKKLRLQQPSSSTKKLIEAPDTVETSGSVPASSLDKIDTNMSLSFIENIPRTNKNGVPPRRALLLIALLLVIVLHATGIGSEQFLGAHGWAYVLNGPTQAADNNLLKDVNTQLKLTPGATAQIQITPQQYIDAIIHKMTLDQKLGQMMLVQFLGPDYSSDLSIMLDEYHVGAVILFSTNHNIDTKTQLKNLVAQMQRDRTIPLAIAIDQEGGPVDRLQALDGSRPSASEIGKSNDPNKAKSAGERDAQDLISYGININLAPVVDVTTVYNAQLDGRTYGNTADKVTKMAKAYLQGLQESGKVIGTLKHFPGLGNVGVDPHMSVPELRRSQADLEQIDWAPYRTLIQQGNVHAIMVTHELVDAVDKSVPSSLSYKVVTLTLRQKLGFQGVIMTDSLTMEAVTAYYASPGKAAAASIEAGTDLLMGASTPAGVAAMIEGIKQDMKDGTISQQRIDDSVRRILMMKYAQGLLPLPKN